MFIVLIFANLNTIACKNKENNISGFYVLGDSLSDTGAGTFAQNQYLENSNNKFKHFHLDKPYYNNCWSSNKVASQLIAEKLNVNFTPGWLFNINGKTFQKFGNNYAYGGEVADSSDSSLDINKVFDLEHQTQMLLLQHNLQKNDIIWIEIGSNDIAKLMTKTDPIIISDVPDLKLTPKIKRILHNNQQEMQLASKICMEYQQQWKKWY